MKKVPFTIFGQTLMIPHRTWTNNKEDIPAKDKWDATLWIERGEDWYALMSYAHQKKTVLICERQDWLKARDNWN